MKNTIPSPTIPELIDTINETLNSLQNIIDNKKPLSQHCGDQTDVINWSNKLSRELLISKAILEHRK